MPDNKELLISKEEINQIMREGHPCKHCTGPCSKLDAAKDGGCSWGYGLFDAKDDFVIKVNDAIRTSNIEKKYPVPEVLKLIKDIENK